MSEGLASDVDNNDLVPMIGMVQGIIGVVLNTLAWMVIVRTKSFHNMTNYLLVYLAVIDSIYCLLIFFDNVILTRVPVTVIGREIYCRIIASNFLSVLPIYSSSYGLCLVTYEQYIGIVHPLHYPRLLSAKKVSFIIFLSWLMTFLFSSPYLFTLVAGNETDNAFESIYPYTFCHMGDIVSLIFGYFLPIIFVSWAYYKIQATLKRSAQQLQQQNVQGAALELLQARQKVINMLRIVTAAMFVLWTPLAIWLMLCSLFQDKKLLESKTGQLVTLLVIAIFNMNSVINPIIYVFKYKKFRKGLQDMLCCCIGRPQRPNRIEVQIVMNEHTT